MRKLLAGAAFAAALTAAAGAAARPFTVDDLLAQESFGAAAFDPTGRWLAYEQRDRYDSAEAYDLFLAQGTSLSRLKLADVASPAATPRDLIGAPRGTTLAGFSPGGVRLAVYRLADRRWTLGIAEVAEGRVRWLDLVPEEARRGRVLQWLSDRELLLLDRPDGRPPRPAASGWILSDRLPRLWADAAAGRGAHTVLGSGRYLALRPRAAPARLLRLDAVMGSESPLAEGAFIDLEVSPDRRRVALFESGADIQPKGDAVVRGAAGTETETTLLSILDLASGRRRPACAGLDVLPNLLSWSPSGGALLVYARRPGALWSAGGFHLVRDGRCTPVGGGLRAALDLNPVGVWTGWMGEQPIAYGRLEGAGRDDWHRLQDASAENLTAALAAAPGKAVRIADAAGLTVVSGGEVWRVQSGRAPERLARGAAPLLLSNPKLAKGARLVRAPATVAWLRLPDGLARLTVDGLQRRPWSAEAGEIVDVASDGEAALVRTTDAWGRSALQLHRPAAGASVLARLNPAWGQTDPLRPQAIAHRGPDGQALTSWLFVPPGASPSRRAPLIVRPYLGDVHPTPPADQDINAGFLQNLRVLTGRGYAVLVPSLPNPGGVMSDPGAGLAARLTGIVDLAAADPRFADRVDFERMALMGWSFGGYTVMKAISQTDRFRAAVSVAGVSDFISYWSRPALAYQVAPESGYTINWTTGGVERTQPSMLGPPWAETDRYVRNSALLSADAVATPLLLLHGAVDLIDVGQSQAMFQALFRQGKDAQLVIYWGMNHTPNAPGDVRDIYGRVFRFLDDHLGPPPLSGDAPPPAYPEPGPASGGPTPPRSPPT